MLSKIGNAAPIFTPGFTRFMDSGYNHRSLQLDCFIKNE